MHKLRFQRLFFPAASILLLTASIGATGVGGSLPVITVTGDSRTVTEPVFPAVCQTVYAAITQVNNDIPTAFDTPPNSTQPDTSRIQAAINACAGTGGSVDLAIDPTDTYNAFLAGPLVLPSNSTLVVDPGVTLFFSRNVQDFDLVSGTHTCGTNGSLAANKACLPPIDIPKNATNVAIMGYGKLNARGGDTLFNGFEPSGTAPASTPNPYTWWNIAALKTQQVPESMIQPETGVNGLTLYKITLQNSSMFHVKSIGSISNFTVWGIKIETPTYTNNTDGVDPDQGTNVTITNSWISDGDDDVALGASGTPTTLPSQAQSSNLSIINNHFYAGHGESIGSFTDGGINNVLFDNNMAAGDEFASHGSSIDATSTVINGSTKGPHYADGNSTAVRIKSDQEAGGLVTNVQYSNSCFLDHNQDILLTPLYNAPSDETGTDTPDVYNILLENLSFLNDAGGFGTLQFTGTHITPTGGSLTTYPLVVTLSNVSFPNNLPTSKFATGSNSPEQYTNLYYGPGNVSQDFITDFTSFVNTVADNDTATNLVTNQTLAPPACNFTYIAPELTGPKGLPQTINYGQTAEAVVILTPAVAKAAYPTGSVVLTDSFNGATTTAVLSGTGDTFFVPLTGLAAGTHSFTMTYAGDSNYVPVSGQPNFPNYSAAGPYVVTVNKLPLTVTANNATKAQGAANPAFSASYSGFINGDGVGNLTGAPSFSTTATTSSPAGIYTVTPSLGTLSAANYSFGPFDSGTLTVVASPTVTLNTTSVISKVSGGYQAVVTVTNNGTGAASNVELTSASLGAATGSNLPLSFGTIAGSGGSASVTVDFPSSAGSDGASVAEKLAGTYTGGTFSFSVRSTTLP